MARQSRFFVAAGIPGPGRMSLEGDAAAHLGRVLRAKPGQEISLFDGAGGEYPAMVITVARKFVEVDVGPRDDADRESPLAITLLQGLCRGERMDLVVRKATELGVTRVVPVVTERSVVRLDPDRTERRLAHWQAVVIAACEQSGRARVPEVMPPLPLARWLGEPPDDAARILLWPGAGRALAGAVAAPGRVTLLVGPEGGLTDAERDAAMEVGFDARSLGPRILRTETAAIAALAVLQSAAGDLAEAPEEQGRRPGSVAMRLVLA